MTPVVEGTNLVVVGNWNPAILQAEWTVRHAIEAEPGNTQVRLEFSAVPGVPPRYTVGNVKFVPTTGRLQMHPVSVNAGNLNLCELYTKRILQLLVHTPIKALGENFLFRVQEPPAAALDEFKIPDDLSEKYGFDFEIHERGVGLAVQIEGGALVSLERSLKKDGSLEFKFNFHYEASSATQANGILTGSTFSANFECAKTILTAHGFTFAEGAPTT